MDDSSGMSEGAPVRLNGIPVGNVNKIELSGSKDPKRVVESIWRSGEVPPQIPTIRWP